ncbi:MAG: hypothetical protein IJP54_01310 [Synergistaceae bacterium]|nr:hypothetical protein [Synergistaceae bacterium]
MRTREAVCHSQRPECGKCVLSGICSYVLRK